MELMIQFLENLESNTQIYADFLGFLELLGGALVEEKPDVASLYMQSAGLDLIYAMANRTLGKRDGLAHIIVSFTPRTYIARIRILEKLDQKFKSDKKNLGSILAHLSGYTIDDRIDSDVFLFYWYKALRITSYGYPSMKCCGMKILSEISRFNVSNLQLFRARLVKLAEEEWWEIKAQILIYCANQLEYVQDKTSFESEGDAVNELERNNLASVGSRNRRADSFGDEDDYS